MGQKANPVGLRVGVNLPWRSRWFNEKGLFKENLLEDIEIRKVLTEKLKMAGLTLVEIERLSKSIVIILTVSRPGMVIGRGGTGLEELKKEVLQILKRRRKNIPIDLKVDFKVQEVKNPEISAQIVLGRIISDLERRIPHRRVVTKTIERVMASGALGVKVVLSGRIGGAEISRREKFHLGSVPAQTLREEIDYAEAPAALKRGYVGVKVYIHKKKE